MKHCPQCLKIKIEWGVTENGRIHLMSDVGSSLNTKDGNLKWRNETILQSKTKKTTANKKEKKENKKKQKQNKAKQNK